MLVNVSALVCVLVSWCVCYCQSLLPTVIFAGKAGAYQSEDPYVTLPLVQATSLPRKY